MVDIFTHQILDMIDSRDYETVYEWLKLYPNLRIISRDGSVTTVSICCRLKNFRFHPKCK